jgi:hypothetical protein
VKGRGALLGPEESGPAHWTWCLGGRGLVFLGHGHTGWFLVWWVAGAGSHQTAGGVHLMGVLFPWMVFSIMCVVV